MSQRTPGRVPRVVLWVCLAACHDVCLCYTVDGSLRLQLSEASLGRIPVQPISYEDAYKFMS